MPPARLGLLASHELMWHYSWMTTQVFFDVEMTSLAHHPQLMSVGLVTLDGREFYVELDLASDQGKERCAQTPWDVRETVLDQFGLFTDSKCDSEWTMGLRAAKWLFGVADSDPTGRVELLYDYGLDLELLVGAMGRSTMWPKLRLVAGERNVVDETSSIGPELASDAAFRDLRKRSPPLYRHHALADAIALRAAWRIWHLMQMRGFDFRQLLDVAGDQEAWLYEWLASPAPALGGLVPLDVLDQADGLQVVIEALHRIEGGCA